jgi:hypothetical protein
MVNEISKEFPQRWKYVGELKIPELCHMYIKINPFNQYFG